MVVPTYECILSIKISQSRQKYNYNIQKHLFVLYTFPRDTIITFKLRH